MVVQLLPPLRQVACSSIPPWASAAAAIKAADHPSQQEATLREDEHGQAVVKKAVEGAACAGEAGESDGGKAVDGCQGPHRQATGGAGESLETVTGQPGDSVNRQQEPSEAATGSEKEPSAACDAGAVASAPPPAANGVAASGAEGGVLQAALGGQGQADASSLSDAQLHAALACWLRHPQHDSWAVVEAVVQV